MTVKQICCDVCGIPYTAQDHSKKLFVIRWMFTKDGWRFSGGKDYCPGCKPLRRDGKPYKGKPHKKPLKYKGVIIISSPKPQ